MQLLYAALFFLMLPILAAAQVKRENTTTRPNTSQNASSNPMKGMLVRISEIQIHAEYLEEYNAILKEEAEASVRLEPGVITIFPMSQRGNPTELRILEIYADRAAYESHLKTPHFQKYKTTTLKMVKALKLVDMDTLDPETMRAMFRKMNKAD
jgi:quinol monooxygenase YgiN